MDNLWIIYGYGWWYTYTSEKYEFVNCQWSHDMNWELGHEILGILGILGVLGMKFIQFWEGYEAIFPPFCDAKLAPFGSMWWMSNTRGGGRQRPDGISG